jgi:hypothetical protein
MPSKNLFISEFSRGCPVGFVFPRVFIIKISTGGLLITTCDFPGLGSFCKNTFLGSHALSDTSIVIGGGTFSPCRSRCTRSNWLMARYI